MDALFSELSEITQAILRTETNFKKLGKANLTVATVKSRLELLEQRWTKCETLHLEIKAGTSAAEREKLEYFSKSKYLSIEDAYLNARDYLFNQLALLTPEPRANESLNQSQIIRHDSLSVKLPQITLPEFSGDYKDWENFRDLFNALIIQNDSLSNVTRLHYLKLALKGEAAGLLKHVAITDANFLTTWESLKIRFDNQRALISAHLQSFISLPGVTPNSVAELRKLRDTTNESLAALKNLKRTTDSWSDILVFLIVKKLDVPSLKEWEMLVGSRTDYPTYKELDTFLEKRIRVLEAIQTSKNLSSDKPKNAKSSSVRSHTASANSKCLLCKENHPLFRCSQFRAQSIDKRQEIAQQNQCCYNCLIPGHKPYSCLSKRKCAKCQRKHNTLLHYESRNEISTESPVKTTASTSVHTAVINQTDKIVQPSTSSGKSEITAFQANHVSTNTEIPSVHFLNTFPNLTSNTLLATALVDVRADNGRVYKFRVLLDQGSECCFASERAVKILCPRYDKINALVYGVGGSEIGSARKLAYFQFLPQEKGCKILYLQSLVLLKLTSYHPPVRSGGGVETQINECLLADPDPFSTSNIDFILGADKFGSCLLPGLKQGILGTLTAQATIFGWILSGPISNQLSPVVSSFSVHHDVITEVLHDDLARFWVLEELPIKLNLNEEELSCEQQFISTHKRLDSGRYMVRLPFKNGPPINIGNSFERARIVLTRTLRRLSGKTELLEQYVDFMSEYEKLGHMNVIQTDNLKDSLQTVYLPHHPIVRATSITTRMRIVFNASSPTSNNSSLNSHLHIGPKILTDLISIIMRWREHRYVYLADVEKMFRQILIDVRDRDYQRILWQSPDKKIAAYQLGTVTYGTACAPYLANRVIKQLAQDEGPNFPLAQDVLENNVYVDDVLFGADTIAEAEQIRSQVVQMMESGGFHLRKWAANDSELLSECPQGQHERALEFPLAEHVQLKVLGLCWDPLSDAFQIKVNSEPIQFPTKRIVLSVIAKLYDPLGWLAPVIVVAKLLMQELWLRKLDWDEKLPDDLLFQWLQYYHALVKLEQLKIPRWTGQFKSNSICELHGFADASTKAYAENVYLRILDESNHAQVTLLLSKTKVAPISVISVPKLELCGAVLLAKISKFVASTMNLESVPIYCHTDSTVVLCWLKKHPSNWKTFVANRVALIHELLPNAKWLHVPTMDNPVDCASRGISSGELLNHPLWWHGPSWLAGPSTGWPDKRPLLDPDVDLELKPQSSHQVSSVEEAAFDLVDKYSSWPKLLRVTAYCLRFIKILWYKISKKQGVKPQYRFLTFQTSEIDQARLFWLQSVQKDSFAIELRELHEKGILTTKSSLKSLNPFLDSRGLLRLGGRLRFAPISYDEKHPIILPRHKISELIASHAHLRSLHGGSQLTLHTLRQNFWILGARSLVKGLINKCISCVRQRAAVPQQLMGNLPEFRITPSRPFTHTGFDYAGPFDIRLGSGRGHKSQKAYISLFICCCTRSVHIELVTDCSSPAFLAAFCRFFSRRGRPAHMYSDNGKNFQGADNELKKWLEALKLDHDLYNQLATEGTSWHFVPPSAPHFGGLWEAGVKSVKHHLRRIVGLHKFTYEEFSTLLTRVEASLNSRPIAPLSADAEDFSYLTPGHFLIGALLTSVPEPSLEFMPENRLSRWELVQRVSQTFWRRWSIDYLHVLQKRHKWFNEKSNINVGDMVLLRQDNLPPANWLLGRVIKCYPGKDGLIRTVKVKTSNSEYDRPISKLCLLPLKSSEQLEHYEQNSASA